MKGGDDRDGAPLLFCADKECYQDLTEGRILDLGGGQLSNFVLSGSFVSTQVFPLLMG